MKTVSLLVVLVTAFALIHPSLCQESDSPTMIPMVITPGGSDMPSSVPIPGSDMPSMVPIPTMEPGTASPLPPGVTAAPVLPPGETASPTDAPREITSVAVCTYPRLAAAVGVAFVVSSLMM
jgi:hypothetical protein